MKKLFTILVAGIFVLASCGNKPAPVVDEPEVQEEKGCCHEMTEEQKADMAAWEDWANQTEEQQVVLLDKFKACIDAKMAEKGECTEECPEAAKKCEEFKAKWATWETLDIAAKKALIDEVKCCKKECCKKEGCEKTCEKPCEK